VRGDIVAPSGASVTFEAGTTLEVAANADEMGMGDNATERGLVSFTFQPGSTLEFGTVGETVLFTSDADEPLPGDWQGVIVNEGTGVFQNAEIEFAEIGLELNGPTAPKVQDARIYYSAGSGIRAEAVRASTDPPSLDILGARIIGTGAGSGI
jgi:hypothetical protein